MLSWIALGLLVIAGIVFMLVDEPGKAIGFTDGDLASLVTGTALLIWIGGSVLLSYRGRAGLALKQAVVWLAFAFTLVVVYSYRMEFQGLLTRVAGELNPGRQVAVETSRDRGSQVVSITAHNGGQFVVEATVNDTHVRMLADTGASAVTLSDIDARRAGIDTATLNYTVRVQTANGRTLAALVRLDRVSVGGITLENVEALIAKPDALSTSLLGMTYLGRLSAVELSGNRLILKE